MSDCNCKASKVQDVIWEQIKTIQMLIDNAHELTDKAFELLQAIQNEREQTHVAVIEQYLRKQLEVAPENKKGAKLENRITFKSVENNIS